MPLTPAERLSFTAAQLVHLDRMINQDRLLVAVQGANESAADYAARLPVYRAKVIGQLANMTPKRLRVRVNIEGFQGSAPTYSEDDDFTAAEKNAIALGYKRNIGRSLLREIVAILDWVTEMQADGLTANIIKALLRAR
jgi:hypothetical protein